MNPVTQANEYIAAWAAPEILTGADTATLEADVFAFGMVVIEVCPRHLLHLVSEPGGWTVHLMSELYLRSLQESIRSEGSQPRRLLQ